MEGSICTFVSSLYWLYFIYQMTLFGALLGSASALRHCLSSAGRYVNLDDTLIAAPSPLSPIGHNNLVLVGSVLAGRVPDIMYDDRSTYRSDFNGNNEPYEEDLKFRADTAKPTEYEARGVCKSRQS